MDSSRRAGPPRRPALLTRGRVSGTARRRRRAALERRAADDHAVIFSVSDVPGSIELPLEHLSVLWVNRRETPRVKSASAAHASVASVVPAASRARLRTLHAEEEEQRAQVRLVGIRQAACPGRRAGAWVLLRRWRPGGAAGQSQQRQNEEGSGHDGLSYQPADATRLRPSFSSRRR